MDNPEILIGIPTLNGPERLSRCLNAIHKYTPLEAMKAMVLVSDDCSYEVNLEANKRVCNNFRIEMLMAQTRIGVAQQWNRLVKHTHAPTVILMNDDVEIVSDWLEALAFSVRMNPHAGMVGLKAYEGVNTNNFNPPKPASYNEAVMERGHGMLASTGFLFGFSRANFDEVGGFDEEYFAFFEEVDFGIRLLERNHPSYMLSYPIVLHQGGATTSDKRNIDAQKVFEASKKRFLVKHWSYQHRREQLIDPRIGYPALVQWNTMLKTWSD
jgi:GT2 family glycosyltransferase